MVCRQAFKKIHHDFGKALSLFEKLAGQADLFEHAKDVGVFAQVVDLKFGAYWCSEQDIFGD